MQPYSSPALTLTSLSMCLYEAWLQNGSSFSSFSSKSVALLNTPFIVLPGALSEANKGGDLFGHGDIWTGGSIPTCLKSVCRLASDPRCLAYQSCTGACLCPTLANLAECPGCAGNGGDRDSPALLLHWVSTWSCSGTLEHLCSVWNSCPSSSWQATLSQVTSKHCGKKLLGNQLQEWSWSCR